MVMTKTMTMMTMVMVTVIPDLASFPVIASADAPVDAAAAAATTTGASSFALADWLVLAAYGMVLVITGVWVSRRRKSENTTDYFLGGRRMPVWAVTISFVATTLSAATFIGGPEQAFRGDLTYLITNVGNILAAIVVAFIFIPVFYRRNVTTVYELLEHRAGPIGKLAASCMFMVGRVFASGARLYIAAVAASLIGFDGLEPAHLVIAILVFTIIGIVYTLIGGVASVIWTDVTQFFIFVGAAGIAAIVLFNRIPLDASGVIDVLQNPDPADSDAASKLTLIQTGLTKETINHPYTLLSTVFGFTLFLIAAYGADQDLTQRMLTCKSSDRGSTSMIASVIVGIPVTLLFMGLGLLLFIFYTRPDVMGGAAPAYAIDDSRTIFLTFIIEEMPVGMTGLMMAGLFAAGLSSLNSALNAMSSTATSDVYRQIAPDRDEAHYLRFGRAAVVGWGVILGGFSIFCVYWHAESRQSLIDFALSVMTFAYSGLLAVFLTILLTKTRGSTWSVLAALLVGFIAITILQPTVWDGIMPDAWRGMHLAFPWRMLAATLASIGVCVIGKSKHDDIADS